MENCKLCGKEIKETSSEHIIHNAIGGILEDPSIYCKTCNAKYGTDQDRAFTEIFAPIVERLSIRKTRKSRGARYKGVMYDKEGNIYSVEYQAGKIRSIKDQKGTFLGQTPSSDMFFGGYEFNLDNRAFKAGLAKIAFNYAVHEGIPTTEMHRLFDRCLVEKPVVIPFIPMTPFDAIMEATEPERLFHALRLFNIGSYLFVYIELFSTFQFYVLVSDECEHNIDRCYSNFIEKNDPINEDLMDILTPKNYKDVPIIAEQYRLNLEEIMERVKRFPDYDNQSESENWALFRKEVGKQAYEVRRKQSYERDYREVVNGIYNVAVFLNIAIEIMKPKTADVDSLIDFIQSFQFYIIYEDDCVNMGRYNRILPDGRGYPEAILQSGADVDPTVYTKSKFRMLEERMRKDTYYEG